MTMKAVQKLIALGSIFFFLFGAVAYAGSKDPVAVISQVKGATEYSKKNHKWKKVRRNKFLFVGYTIRTGKYGEGRITNKLTGENFMMGPNSEIKVTAKGIHAVKGKLKKAATSNQLAVSLMKRFDKSQSFTTVRRSQSKKKTQIDAVRELVVYSDYPFVVWENLGKQYSYKLTVGKKVYKVPATKNAIVRAKIQPVKGTVVYSIEAYKNGKKAVSMKPNKRKGKIEPRTITWLEGSEQKKLSDSVSALQKEYPDNAFMLGNYFEDQQLYVAAMEKYRQYLKDNPDEIEMAPYLFRVYKKLKLDKTYRAELEEYKAQLLE